MIRIAGFAALALLCLPACAMAQDCKLDMIASLPMQGDNMIMVPATLGDKQTTLLLDTGGTFSMIGTHILDTIQPRPPVAKIVRAFTLVNGHVLDKSATVRPFALGRMQAGQFRFLVMPDGEVGPKDLDGTIAPDILANFDLDLDFAHKKVNLFSQNHCAGKVVYWSKDWSEIPFDSFDHLHINLPMTLDGKPMRATLDTGSSRSFISAGVAKRMFGIDAQSEGAKPAEKSDEAADMKKSADTQADSGTFLYRFKTLSVEGLTISNPEFMVLPDKGTSELNHVGMMLLGMPELQKMHIYIAYRENKLYVTPASAGTVSAAPVSPQTP